MGKLFALLMLVASSIGAGPAAPVLPDGTYRYDVTIGGHTVGTSTIVIRRDGGAIGIGESASLAGTAVVSNREIDEATFATVSYTGEASGKRATVSIAGNEASVTQNGVSAKFSAPSDSPIVVGDNRVAAFAQIPATLHVTGAEKLTLACVCGGQFILLPVTVVGDTGTVLTISVQSTTIALHYDAQSFVLRRAEIPAQEAAFALESYDAKPTALPQPVIATPLPLPPARYASRDVAIRADDGVMLAGTLSVPRADRRPLPAFVFVHGSGCNDRDETIGPNKVFAQLANALSNDGYAVLRYDKRSCGKSGGVFPVRDRLIADALDVVAYLRAQPGIDPNRIFMLGHSEGGELVPSIAIADGRLRGIVLLAPPAIPLEKIMMQQTLHFTAPADRAAAAQKERAELEAIAAGKRSGSFNAWLRSSFGIDPAAVIAKVPCPILVVQGTKDIQVLPSDTPRLVAAARAAHRQVSVVMLPGDDHIFMKLPPGATSTIGEYFTPSYLDPALFTAIESWLANLR